ncbi:MAG TPA: hypothetical protein VJ805_09080 [Nitrospiraceae bacterium]|nr:hypothetical protein [Nitrospiraceae bacterium]
MLLRVTVAVFFCSLSLGCALFPKDHQDQYVVCPYDTVWNAATETMKAYPMKTKDKENGVIETGWTEMEGDERGFGLFQRTSSGFGNRERARMVLTVKRVNEVTEVVVTESRERWHLKGGVTSQATKWWPIEPSEEAMAAIMARINTKIKDQGCSPS